MVVFVGATAVSCGTSALWLFFLHSLLGGRFFVPITGRGRLPVQCFSVGRLPGVCRAVCAFIFVDRAPCGWGLFLFVQVGVLGPFFQVEGCGCLVSLEERSCFVGRHLFVPFTRSHVCVRLFMCPAVVTRGAFVMFLGPGYFEVDGWGPLCSPRW